MVTTKLSFENQRHMFYVCQEQFAEQIDASGILNQLQAESDLANARPVGSLEVADGSDYYVGLADRTTTTLWPVLNILNGKASLLSPELFDADAATVVYDNVERLAEQRRMHFPGGDANLLAFPTIPSEDFKVRSVEQRRMPRRISVPSLIFAQLKD